MHCPFCSAQDTKVIDSRIADDGLQVRRRRECADCNQRFTTFETFDLEFPRVIKNDGRRNKFEQEKLRAGILKALEKRPVSMSAIDRAVAYIIQQIRSMGEREIRSEIIGDLVMQQLRTLDEVAYVRFASIYRQFQDIDAFHAEIAKLKEQNAHE